MKLGRKIFKQTEHFFEGIARSKIILQAILVGLISGVLVVLFKVSINKLFNIIQNFLSQFDIMHKLLKNDKSEYDYDEQHGQHRMYYEFVEFVKIFEQKDYDRAQEMMQKSLIAMKIATLARKSAGVEFPADKR